MIRPMPPDFPDMWAKLGSSALTKHYQASSRTIQRWAREKGLSKRPFVPRPRHLLPADFGTMAPTMPKKTLMAHYHVSQKVIDRWICEAGVVAKQTKGTVFKLAAFKVDIPPPKRETAYDLAADYLRRFMPVSRCDLRGKFSHTGDYFRAGQNIYTFAELIEKAARMKARREMEMI